jgi:hypothetical protein
VKMTVSTAATTVRQAAASYATGVLATAALWDLAGHLGALPPWWPPVSYVLIAAGIASGCIAVFLRVLQRSRHDPAGRGATLIELVAFGIFLGAWLLRGDAEVPADRPLVAAGLLAAALLLGTAWRRRR